MKTVYEQSLSRKRRRFFEVVLVRVPTVRFDLDERDTGFDQPPGKQATLPERRTAVAVADGVFFVGQVERLQPRTQYQLRRALIHRPVIFDLVARPRLGEIGLQVFEQTEPAVEALAVDAAGQFDVA